MQSVKTIGNLPELAPAARRKFLSNLQDMELVQFLPISDWAVSESDSRRGQLRSWFIVAKDDKPVLIDSILLFYNELDTIAKESGKTIRDDDGSYISLTWNVKNGQLSLPKLPEQSKP